MAKGLYQTVEDRLKVEGYSRKTIPAPDQKSSLVSFHITDLDFLSAERRAKARR